MSGSANPSPRARRVWDRLQNWYGSRLTEQFGTEPPPDWCRVVDTHDNDEVKRALSVIQAEHQTHPPTFPQFEKAFKPPVKHAAPRGLSLLEKFSAWIVRNYRLTPTQLRGPWTYLGRESDAPDHTGKIVERHAVEITGVIIAADGDSPGHRIMVVDMQMSEAA
jgi:hypothetical protein